MSGLALIEMLQKAIAESESGDVEVSLEEVGGDRYGNEIGLKAGDQVLLKEYFGGESPLW